jgi:GWxTD domain-containing protein
MRYLFTISLMFTFFAGHSQALRDINYVYQYNPAEPFSFDMRTIRDGDRWTVFYKLQLTDTSLNTNGFTIQWETRETIADKEGTALSPADFQGDPGNEFEVSGSLQITGRTSPLIVVAKVIQTRANRAWMFYKMLEPNFPVDGYVTVNGSVLMNTFIKSGDPVVLKGSQQKIVSYYNDHFPAALPPFAEGQARVSKGMQTDSTFIIAPEQELRLAETGLYLIQKDSNATDGIAFRVEDDYPKFSKITSLAGPLVYICTKQEYDRLVLAKNEKKAFDRVILGITSDTDRARKLMRTYFRRVEIANHYFTSYKEGWKSDRGMIFIVFGMPDKVLRFNDREVWSYDNDFYKVTFNFTKSSSIFDPENYVLIRDKKYRDTWYEVIDLWRNSRF